MDGPVTARSEPLRTWPGKTCVIRLGSGVFMAQVRDAGDPWLTLRRCLSYHAPQTRCECITADSSLGHGVVQRHRQCEFEL
jgi:hypothetical protein